MRRLVALGMFTAFALGAGPPYTLRTEHYRIETRVERDLAVPIGEHMDAVYEAYEARFPTFRRRNAAYVRMKLLEDATSYHEFLAANDISAGSSAGIFFWKNSRAYLATYMLGLSDRRRQSVLQHEGFHQFAFMRIGQDLPAWLEEGLGEYFGEGIMAGGELRTGIATPSRIAVVRRLIDDGGALPFAEIMRITGPEWGRAVGNGTMGHLYAQAWSMAHFLMHAEDGRFEPMLIRYLELHAREWDPSRAFAEAFGDFDVEAFEAAWKAYVQQLEPDELSLAAERLEFLGVGMARLHERGVAMESFEELRASLEGIQFQVRKSDEGGVRELSAQDGSMFEAPAPAAPGEVAPEIRLVAPVGDFPPGLEVVGLRAVVSLSWERTDGRLISRIGYR
jgi:hypothetical protein